MGAMSNAASRWNPAGVGPVTWRTTLVNKTWFPGSSCGSVKVICALVLLVPVPSAQFGVHFLQVRVVVAVAPVPDQLDHLMSSAHMPSSAQVSSKAAGRVSFGPRPQSSMAAADVPAADDDEADVPGTGVAGEAAVAVDPAGVASLVAAEAPAVWDVTAPAPAAIVARLEHPAAPLTATAVTSAAAASVRDRFR